MASTKVIVLGDLHLISPDDPDEDRKVRRAHFAQAWPSFRDLVRAIRGEAPDLVVALGDLVDWYSEPNRDFARSLLDGMGAPWAATPGNHDLSFSWEGKPETDDGDGPAPPRSGWAEAGIEMGNRCIDLDDTRLLLMDSATSRVPEATVAWLDETLGDRPRNLLFTHVPLRHDEVASRILAEDPHRNMEKYIQHTDLFGPCLRGRVDAVYTGHLHFPADLTVEGTRMRMLPLSTRSPLKEYRGQGVTTVLTFDGQDGWEEREIRAR